MAIAKLITPETVVNFLPVRNQKICRLAVYAAGSSCSAELFDGTIGIIVSASIQTAGTGYLVGDTLTLEQSEGLGEQAVFEVVTVGGSGEVLTVNPISGGSGYIENNVYSTTTDSVAGAGAEIVVDAIEDQGVSFAKVAALQETSKSMPVNHLSINGVSARVTGSQPKAYIYYE